MAAGDRRAKSIGLRDHRVAITTAPRNEELSRSQDRGEQIRPPDLVTGKSVPNEATFSIHIERVQFRAFKRARDACGSAISSVQLPVSRAAS